MLLQSVLLAASSFGLHCGLDRHAASKCHAGSQVLVCCLTALAASPIQTLHLGLQSRQIRASDSFSLPHHPRWHARARQTSKGQGTVAQDYVFLFTYHTYTQHTHSASWLFGLSSQAANYGSARISVSCADDGVDIFGVGCCGQRSQSEPQL